MEAPDTIVRLSDSLQGRYRVESELGEGGMATVYLADDLKHERKVALKVLKPDVASSLGTKRFLREIRVTAGLDHPHIVPLLDSGQVGEFLYYAMPYLGGESLRERLKRDRQLPVEDVMSIIRDIAGALGHAHQADIVHRDVKPENIMLSDGHARVLDFGIARAFTVAAGETMTQTGLAIGTVIYMSPEQATGERPVDLRSDIYSTACVAYEMLTGEPPYSGATSAAVLAKKSVEDVPSVRVVRPSVPEAADAVIRTGLSSIPADRHSTITEFAHALSEAMAQGASPRRRSIPMSVYALALAVVVGFGAWTVLGRSGTGVAMASLAVLPCENVSGDDGKAYFVEGMRDALSGQLGRISSLEMTSRASAMRYAGSTSTSRQIGRELGVDGLLECSVLVVDDRVQITIGLVQASTDRTLWTDTYAHGLGQSLSVMSEVAQTVAERIEAVITSDERSQLASVREVDPEALDHWLRGNYQAGRGFTPDALRRAVASYQAAIARAPEFAPAFANLALTYVQLGGWQGDESPDEMHGLAQAAAERALALDPTLAEAHIAHAQIKRLFEWDWEAAEVSFVLARRLNPGFDVGTIQYPNFLVSMGRTDEAIEIARGNLGRDPTSPASYNELGWALQDAGEFDEALAIYQSGLQIDPDFLQSHVVIAYLYSRMGDVDAVIPHLDFLENVWESPTHLSWIGFLSARVERIERASAILAQLISMRATTHVPAIAIADVQLALGYLDDALESLQSSVERRDPFAVWLPTAWWYEPLRGDDRFEELVSRIAIPD